MKRILIADDEKEALSILAKSLQRYDYTVITASSGKEALDAVEALAPDLCLLDIVMPDMDGYQLVSAMRANKGLKNVPIIFITGKELLPQSIEKRIGELGAYDYIMKPCSFEDILSRVRTILG